MHKDIELLLESLDEDVGRALKMSTSRKRKQSKRGRRLIHLRS
jgi:hypothetical protein